MNNQGMGQTGDDDCDIFCRPPSSVLFCPQPTAYSPRSSSPGIALVMVLGILSVMVIMAVAFAISMRTERVAAGNYADSVRARQLVQVGLARAMNDLAMNLGPTGLYQPDGKAYPNWVVTNSYTNAYTNTATNVYVLYATNGSTRANEATNFVPHALWTAATNADYTNAANHWLPLDSLIYTNDAFGTTYLAESNRMGRVKYLILNCSGLLDANFAGRTPPNRGVGTNPMEIVINNMPEFENGDASAFLGQRDAEYRYETLEELAALRSANFNGAPSNFVVYSHALPGYWDTNPPVGVGTQVNLSGSASDLTNRMSEITNAFARAGFSQFESGVLYSNLIDYVDSDPIPSNDTTCVEAVPMINEIVVSNVVTDAGGGNVTMNTTIYFELWYPFVRDSADTFELQYNAAFLDLGGAGFVPPNVVWKSLAPAIGTPGRQSFTVRSDSLPPLSQLAGAVKFKSTIDAKVILLVGVQKVDGVYSIVLTNENVGVPSVSIAGSECFDPRFNGDPVQWSYQAVPTLGFMNTTNINYFAQNPDSAGETNMYVANGPLQSVGELGYLAYAPWRTVKLYGPNCQRVLDVFASDANSADYVTNTFWRGRVNPNASNTAVLSAVFSNMPLDEYPVGVTPIPASEAQDFVDKIQANAFYTNLSDVGRKLNDADFPPAYNELQREAILRNTCGLLNVRQNLFTVIIEAQVASGGNIPRNPVRQRAVALVWRDPYTGEMFVRSIKWLKD